MFNKAVFLAFITLCLHSVFALAVDPLPSWNEGQTKQRIIEFVSNINKEGTKTYVEPSQRIAVFDNDGTLWAEQPVYFQVAFAFDRLKELAKTHPEYKEKQPFKAVLENDMKTLASFGEKGLLEIIAATHAGMTTTEFEEDVKKWITSARHPRFDVLYTDLVYQPMIELLAYLRDNQFKTFIVSGGGVEFMRPWATKSYGIPTEQIIGSSCKVKYELQNGKPVLVRLPEVFFIDDKTGKPAGINLFIGHQPIMAFGNSDGDLEMLEWTTLRTDKPSLGMIVHHDDAKREWAYDRNSHVGRLDKALDAAPKYGWSLISMKNDWKNIFLKEEKTE